MNPYEEQANKWMSVRLAVSSALIIGSIVMYVASWFTMLRKDMKKPFIHLSQVSSKYYLFGLAALMSLNYAQAGLYQTIMAFFTMLLLVVLVGSCLVEMEQNKRTILYIVYYLALFAWYLGIVVDFYVTFR